MPGSLSRVIKKRHTLKRKTIISPENYIWSIMSCDKRNNLKKKKKSERNIKVLSIFRELYITFKCSFFSLNFMTKKWQNMSENIKSWHTSELLKTNILTVDDVPVQFGNI